MISPSPANYTKPCRHLRDPGQRWDPDEIDAMIASGSRLQSLLPMCTPEEERIRLSKNQWNLQATIRKAPFRL